MKIYLAGGMSNLPEFNFPAFDAAAKKLRQKGHEVFSPPDKDREVLGLNPDETGDHPLLKTLSLRKCLGWDLSWILEHAEAIALLPGWEKSTGANVEHTVAKAIGLKFIYLRDEDV